MEKSAEFQFFSRKFHGTFHTSHSLSKMRLVRLLLLLCLKQTHSSSFLFDENDDGEDENESPSSSSLMIDEEEEEEEETEERVVFTFNLTSTVWRSRCNPKLLMMRWNTTNHNVIAVGPIGDRVVMMTAPCVITYVVLVARPRDT